MHLNNAFTLFRIANMLKEARKIFDKLIRESLASQDNRNKEINKNKKKHASKNVPNIMAFRI